MVRGARHNDIGSDQDPYGETDPQRILDYLKNVPSRLAA
jgi:hypothetical protein